MNISRDMALERLYREFIWWATVQNSKRWVMIIDARHAFPTSSSFCSLLLQVKRWGKRRLLSLILTTIDFQDHFSRFDFHYDSTSFYQGQFRPGWLAMRAIISTHTWHCWRVETIWIRDDRRNVLTQPFPKTAIAATLTNEVAGSSTQELEDVTLQNRSVQKQASVSLMDGDLHGAPALTFLSKADHGNVVPGHAFQPLLSPR